MTTKSTIFIEAGSSTCDANISTKNVRPPILFDECSRKPLLSSRATKLKELRSLSRLSSFIGSLKRRSKSADAGSSTRDIKAQPVSSSVSLIHYAPPTTSASVIQSLSSRQQNLPTPVITNLPPAYQKTTLTECHSDKCYGPRMRPRLRPSSFHPICPVESHVPVQHKPHLYQNGKCAKFSNTTFPSYVAGSTVIDDPTCSQHMYHSLYDYPPSVGPYPCPITQCPAVQNHLLPITKVNATRPSSMDPLLFLKFRRRDGSARCSSTMLNRPTSDVLDRVPRSISVLPCASSIRTDSHRMEETSCSTPTYTNQSDRPTTTTTADCDLTPVNEGPPTPYVFTSIVIPGLHTENDSVGCRVSACHSSPKLYSPAVSHQTATSSTKILTSSCGSRPQNTASSVATTLWSDVFNFHSVDNGRQTIDPPTPCMSQSVWVQKQLVHHTSTAQHKIHDTTLPVTQQQKQLACGSKDSHYQTAGSHARLCSSRHSGAIQPPMSDSKLRNPSSSSTRNKPLCYQHPLPISCQPVTTTIDFCGWRTAIRNSWSEPATTSFAHTFNVDDSLQSNNKANCVTPSRPVSALLYPCTCLPPRSIPNPLQSSTIQSKCTPVCGEQLWSLENTVPGERCKAPVTRPPRPPLRTSSLVRCSTSNDSSDVISTGTETPTVSAVGLAELKTFQSTNNMRPCSVRIPSDIPTTGESYSCPTANNPVDDLDVGGIDSGQQEPDSWWLQMLPYKPSNLPNNLADRLRLKGRSLLMSRSTRANRSSSVLPSPQASTDPMTQSLYERVHDSNILSPKDFPSQTKAESRRRQQQGLNNLPLRPSSLYTDSRVLLDTPGTLLPAFKDFLSTFSRIPPSSSESPSQVLPNQSSPLISSFKSSHNQNADSPLLGQYCRLLVLQNSPGSVRSKTINGLSEATKINSIPSV